MRRKPVAARAVYDALDSLKVDGFDLSWDEANQEWRLTDPDSPGYRRDVIAKSKTLEGLDANYVAWQRRQKKKPFKRTKVLVFPGYGAKDPWVGAVVSRDRQQITVSKEDSNERPERSTFTLGRPFTNSQPEVFLYDEDVFQALCALRADEMEFKRKKIQTLAKLQAKLTEFEANDTDHPMQEKV